MPLFPNSGYRIGENGKRITATKVTQSDVDKTFLHDRKRFTLDDLSRSVLLREAQTGEQIDLIAYEACGISTKWYIIADINDFFYVDEDVEQGAQVLVPDIEDLKSL